MYSVINVVNLLFFFTGKSGEEQTVYLHKNSRSSCEIELQRKQGEKSGRHSGL
jgi:hypothetical protein